jgi:uncharacterized membrane protein YkvA (DUF1232 family)
VETWQIVSAGAVVGLLLMGVGAWFLWRTASARSRSIARRIQRLPWRSKLALAGNLFRDDQIPRRTRLVLVGLALYLAMPLDIVPDFVPVLGQLDDILVVAVGVAFMVRSIPQQVLESHITSVEALSPR